MEWRIVGRPDSDPPAQLSLHNFMDLSCIWEVTGRQHSQPFLGACSSVQISYRTLGTGLKCNACWQAKLISCPLSGDSVLFILTVVHACAYLFRRHAVPFFSLSNWETGASEMRDRVWNWSEQGRWPRVRGPSSPFLGRLCLSLAPVSQLLWMRKERDCVQSNIF